MGIKRDKVQFTLPASLVQKIEDDIKNNFTNKSLWFERLVRDYFKEFEEKENTRRNIIELNF